MNGTLYDSMLLSSIGCCQRTANTSQVNAYKYWEETVPYSNAYTCLSNEGSMFYKNNGTVILSKRCSDVFTDCFYFVYLESCRLMWCTTLHVSAIVLEMCKGTLSHVSVAVYFPWPRWANFSKKELLFQDENESIWSLRFATYHSILKITFGKQICVWNLRKRFICEILRFLFP